MHLFNNFNFEPLFFLYSHNLMYMFCIESCKVVWKILSLESKW